MLRNAVVSDSVERSETRQAARTPFRQPVDSSIFLKVYGKIARRFYCVTEYGACRLCFHGYIGNKQLRDWVFQSSHASFLRSSYNEEQIVILD